MPLTYILSHSVCVSTFYANSIFWMAVFLCILSMFCLFTIINRLQKGITNINCTFTCNGNFERAVDLVDKKEASVMISDGKVMLPGILEIPQGAAGIVIFAHGSGSSRFSPRNSYVAEVLRKHGLGTLLMDLMTPEEERDYDRRFDIALLTRRLLAATKWLREQEPASKLVIGYFGASTGAAAAIEAAAALGDEIGAVVSRGGRPDMAWSSLERVKAPTLFIVGGHDHTVVELNEKAFEKITAVKELKIVPRAGHLFEERGALESVAELAAAWFKKYLMK